MKIMNVFRSCCLFVVLGLAVPAFGGRGDVISRVSQEASDRVTAEVRSSQVRLHLIQGLSRGAIMDHILRWAAEFDVEEIFPVYCSNSDYPIEKAVRKMDQWKGIMIEACRKTKDPTEPRLHTPQNLQAALEELPPSALLVAGSMEPRALSWKEFSEKHLRRLPRSCTDVYLAIGPSGDFSPEEYEVLRRKNFIPVTLGRRTLSAETASLTLIAATQMSVE